MEMAVGIIVLAFIIAIFVKPKRRRRKSNKKPQIKGTITDLEIVYGAEFKAQRIINNEEVKVYNALLKKLVYDSKEYRVFPQVNLGEILTTNTVAYGKINSKRPDFCVTNKDYMPIAIVEYHGGGHYQGNYKERDKIKQVAAEKARLF